MKPVLFCFFLPLAVLFVAVVITWDVKLHENTIKLEKRVDHLEKQINSIPSYTKRLYKNTSKRLFSLALHSDATNYDLQDRISKSGDLMLEVRPLIEQEKWLEAIEKMHKVKVLLDVVYNQ